MSTPQEQAQRSFAGLARALKYEGFEDLYIANTGGWVMVLFVVLDRDANGAPRRQLLFSEPWKDERGGYGNDPEDMVYEFTYEGWGHEIDGYPMWISATWDEELGRDRWRRYARAVRKFVEEVIPRLRLTRADWESRYDVKGRKNPR